MLDQVAAARTRVLHEGIGHDSARKQVTGVATYIDDLREPVGTLQVYIAPSPHAHARILAANLSKVAAAPGVHAVLTSKDISGVDDVSCLHLGDEPVFAR